MSQEPNKSQDLVSIITPVYNTGECLKQCLQSCIDQTYSNIEIIAVDDCSTDQYTREILKEFEAKDPRVKVIWCPENHGQGYCRNVGVDNCKGKYFTFIDSDDYFKPEFVENMYNGLEEFKTDFAICDTYNYVDDPSMYEMKLFTVNDSETRFNFSSPDKTIINNHDLASIGYLISFPASCYGKMFNTERYRESGVRFYDGEFSHHCQDEDWATLTILKLKNFVVLKFVGLMRRMRNGTASMPSLEYFRCAIDAAFRRYMVIKGNPYDHFYVNSIALSLLNRATRLSYLHEEFKDRLKVVELTHEYLMQFSSQLNVNPYYYSWFISKGWHPILGSLDTKPLPLVYFSQRPLHGSFNNETYYMKHLLECFASYGIFTTSFNSLQAHEPASIKIFQHIEKSIIKFSKEDKEPDGKVFNPNSPLLEFKDNGVSYIVAKTSRYKTPDQCQALDVEFLRQGLVKTVKSYLKRKDGNGIVMFSGGDLLTQSLAYVIKKLGKKVVYMVSQNEDLNFHKLKDLNPNSVGYISFIEYVVTKSLGEMREEAIIAGETPIENTTFQLDLSQEYLFAPQDFDAVFGITQFYAQRYSELYGTKAEFMGTTINPWVETIQEKKSHEQITFVSPTIENGLALFIKLVQRCNEQHLKYNFVILQDLDDTLQSSLAKLHDKKGNNISAYRKALSSITIVNDQQIDPLSLASLSHILLKPVVTDSASMSTTLEATFNDVTVIGSNCDKLKGFLGDYDKAIYLDLPASTKKDPTCIPSDEEIQPWFDALQKTMDSTWEATTPLEERQDKYRKIMESWVTRLYEIAGIPEVHNHEYDVRDII